MLNNLKNFTDVFFHGKLYPFINRYLPILADRLPSPFKEEIQGMSELTGIPYGEMVLYNIFYELFTVCTSVIAKNADGTLYHARNLDFGLFLGSVSVSCMLY
jgi:acid ceramidase